MRRTKAQLIGELEAAHNRICALQSMNADLARKVEQWHDLCLDTVRVNKELWDSHNAAQAVDVDPSAPPNTKWN